MTKETIWLIIAGFTALCAAPLIFIGLEQDMPAFVTAGLLLFFFSMAIAPLLLLHKVLTTRK